MHVLWRMLIWPLSRFYVEACMYEGSVTWRNGVRDSEYLWIYLLHESWFPNFLTIKYWLMKVHPSQILPCGRTGDKNQVNHILNITPHKDRFPTKLKFIPNNSPVHAQRYRVYWTHVQRPSCPLFINGPASIAKIIYTAETLLKTRTQQLNKQTWQ